MARMRITLPPKSLEALQELAARERRDTRSQAEIIIIAELHRRGLVSEDGTLLAVSTARA